MRRPLTPFPRAAVLAAILVAGVSCVGGEPSLDDGDSTVDTAAAIDENDPGPADASTEPATVVQQAQTRIGRIQLLGDPQSGSCVATGDPAVGVRYTYEGDWPMRTVRLETSDATARAAIRMLDVQSTQRSGTYDETESIYVLFGGDGGIQQGRRRYFSSEAPPTREESPLLSADSAAVTQLARQVLDWCKRPSGAR
ncbi:MAG TPA: hypothetical protein VFK56_02730 [Mycobacterium sp.]|nr:hypothetical protein [Mycobacterium sp.]